MIFFDVAIEDRRSARAVSTELYEITNISYKRKESAKRHFSAIVVKI